MKRISFFTTLFVIFSLLGFAQNNNGVNIEKKYSDTGVTLKAVNKELKIYYKLYNYFYNSYGEGEIGYSGLYIPYDTEICFWTKNKNEKTNKVNYFFAEEEDKEEVIQVLNPKVGSWKEKQKLIIKSDERNLVMYSIDKTDPEKFGLIYTEPILLDKTGTVNLWIKAIKETGEVYEKKIKYSVLPNGNISDNNYVINENNFYKDFSKEPYRMLSWNFIEFNLEDSVSYLIKEDSLNLKEPKIISEKYTAPIFLDRTKDVILYWSSSSYNNGKINKIDLPKKPVLLGVPLNITSKPVELKLDDARFTYFVTEKNTPDYFYLFESFKNLDKLNLTYSKLKIIKDNKVNLDVNLQTKKKFNIKIPVFYKNIFQGFLYAKFLINKVLPKNPKVIFDPAFSPTNIPVTIHLPNDDGLVIKIEPPIYKKENGKIVLTGKTGEKINYKVNVFSIDATGNKSSAIQKNISIDRNSIFVDSSSKIKNPTGNSSAPFSSINGALKHIDKNSLSDGILDREKWKIYLRGNFILNEAILISKNIKIVSVNRKSIIKFPINAGFVVNNALLELENCEIVRREYAAEPRSVPIIYASNSTIKLNGVSINAIEGQSVLNAFYSHLDIANTKIQSFQTNINTIFNLDNCSAVFTQTCLAGEGSSVVGISASNSNIEFDDVLSELKTDFTARVLQAWDSQITIGKMNCKRLPETASKDIAVWYNRNSGIDIKFNPIITGYAKPIEREP